MCVVDSVRPIFLIASSGLNHESNHIREACTHVGLKSVPKERGIDPTSVTVDILMSAPALSADRVECVRVKKLPLTCYDGAEDGIRTRDPVKDSVHQVLASLLT